jgi:hypothetical protein
MVFLYSLPAALLLVLSVALALVCTNSGQLFVHRRFGGPRFLAHNEVGGIIVAVAGTIYAAMLGFLTVVAWQHFQEANALVVLEADADIDAWHTAVALQPAVRNRVRTDMINYATLMINVEWPAMRHGRFAEDAVFISMDAIDAVATMVPANAAEANAQRATLDQLTILHDARQRRVAINGSGISWFQWLVLIEGAICLAIFCWLLGIRNLRVHQLMTSALVVLIVSILVLLFELQYPFRSDIGIGPETWQHALAHIRVMQTGDQVRNKGQ